MGLKYLTLIYQLYFCLLFNGNVYSVDSSCDLQLGNTCFDISEQKSTFSDAENSCFSKNGTLAILDNDTKIKGLAKSLAEKNITQAFIGLTDRAQRGIFRWANNSILLNEGLIVQRGWAEKNTEICISLNIEELFVKSPCNTENYFICEINKDVKPNPVARKWSEWITMNDPKESDQILTVQNIRKSYPSVCTAPDKVECQVAGTGIPPEKTADKFQMPCSKNGLICLNSDQNDTSTCQQYQLRFYCPTDIDECSISGMAKCDPNSKCINTYGSYKCVCNPGFSGDGKTCFKINQCVAWGDPHYVSFDNVVHHFMGICSYRLTETCFKNNTVAASLTPFQIVTANEHRGINNKVSFAKSVTLILKNQTITLAKDGVLLINGLELNPPQIQKIDDIEVTIIYGTKGIRAQTSFGVVVLYDGVARVTVSVPDTYANQLCGMCGNMNGNSNDEWTLSDGTQTDDREMWGNSWMSAVQDEANCAKLNLTLPHNLCDDQTNVIVTEKCSVLTNPTGPFSTCHALVDPQTIYPSCYFDMCSDPQNTDLLCSSYQIYADQCAAMGVLLNWRPATGCTVKCGANQHYQSRTSGCQASCDNPFSEDSCSLRETSGCVCNDGFLRSGTSCKPKEQCGCYDSYNNYKAIGDVWFTDFCSTKNTCTGTFSILKDTNVQCHQYGECFNSTDKGQSECRCLKGFEGKPDNCTDIDECSRGSYVCSPDGDCINTLGNYDCKCKVGFSGDGLTCKDINECTDKTANCSVYATCYNTHGSYKCICQNGYEGDGNTCSEIPIKPVNPDQQDCSFHQDATCDSNALCTDLPNGGFSCNCVEGSFGDGFKGMNHTGCSYDPCPQNSWSYEGYCYRILTVPNNQTKNEEICGNQGGHLATFASIMSHNFISEQLEIFGKNVSLYVGYSALTFKETYMPIDFSLVSFQNWATGHPKAGLSCMVILPFGSSEKYKFMSVDCSENYPAICKFPASPRKCAEGWKEIGGKCVALFPQPKNVVNSAIECAKYGGDLVIIPSNDTSKTIFNRLLKLLSGKYWFGLNKNLLQRSSTVQWRNIQDVSFTNYATSNRSVLGMSPDIECFQIQSTGKWISADCNEQADGFLCEKPQNVFYRCPTTSEYFNGKCYKPVPEDSVPASQKACSSAGGDLISIATYGEQMFLESYLRNKNIWNSYWIGLQENLSKPSTFFWSDNSTFEYTNWNSKEPGLTGSANCFIVDGSKSNQLPWAEKSCSSKYPGICEYTNTPCTGDKDCNTNGLCRMGQCQCKAGFKGDGLMTCANINECLNNPNTCGINEVCTDTIGSYNCSCLDNYVRLDNGTCQNKLFCLGDADCAKNGKCYKNLCSCNLGFEGDGKLSCTDINECNNPVLNKCNTNATCTNLVGSYSCKCNSGFTGDGKNCQLTAINCHEYLLQNPGTPSGVYGIDPDGTGPLPLIDVTCVMKPNLGITIINHDNTSPKKIVNPKPLTENRTITYEFPLTYVLPIVASSKFCYQDMEFQCDGFLELLTTTNYIDINGKIHKKWGSSTTENKCGCGEINICESPEKACFCDGDYHSPGYDTGRIIDKSLLPLTGILTGGNGYYLSGTITIGPLACGPRPFNFPKNCQDAKDNYGLIKNGVVWLDVDGDGPLEPIRALCDVTTKSFAVTKLPHNKIPGSIPNGYYSSFPGPLKNPTSPNKDPQTCFSYPASDPAIRKLIDDSGSCTQEVKYDCQEGATLLDNKAFLQTLSGKNLDYFGSGSNGKCACGVYNSCTDPTASCNCDGKNAGSDFGFIRKKEDLPIKCISDLNKSPNPSNFTVGPLICGPAAFYLEPSCNEWIKRGYTVNYTYLIDPDGMNPNNNSKNVDEFLVICTMVPYPPHGISTIPGKQRDQNCVNQTDNLCKTPVEYPIKPEQLKPLIDRASHCQQRVKYTCKIMTLLTPYVGQRNPYSFWRTYGSENTIKNKSYFAGDGTNNATCDCGLQKSCNSCFCDVSSNDKKVDDGYLLKKVDLPIGAVWIGSDPTVPDLISTIEIGNLECFETFPSCEMIWKNFKSTVENFLFWNVYRTIDPDGPFGENPILVKCSKTTTSIVPEIPTTTIDDTNVTYIGPKKICFDVGYVNRPNVKQIKKLTSLSNTCKQYMKLSCRATPLTDYVEWYDVDGASRPGWAGNSDGNECACGEVDSCRGGRNFSCNCDSMSSDLFYDHGLLVNKDILPVSRVCIGLTERPPPRNVNRLITLEVGGLTCDPVENAIFPDCQLLRENQYQDEFRKTDPRSEAWIIDPDGSGPQKPFTVYCDMKVDLPVGITVLNPKPNPSICSNTSLTNEDQTINIEYLGASANNIMNLTNISSFCEQIVSYDCMNAPLFDGNQLGAYDYSGNYINYWIGPNDANSCTTSNCMCNKVDGEMRSDSGKFTNKLQLPLSKIVLPKITGTRKLCVKELRCYNLPRTCEEYNNLRRLDINKGNRNNIWAIDTDQAGGEDYFGVQCKTVDSIVVTETLQKSNPQVTNSTTANAPKDVLYVDSNMIQIHNLVNVSNFCSQRIDYTCKTSGTLFNKGTDLRDYRGNKITSWAGADFYGLNDSCACNVLGTCPAKLSCRCDELLTTTQYEGGIFTNKNLLPIKQIIHTTSQNVQSRVYAMDCGSAPFDIPKDCIEARTKGYTSDTEVLIKPRGASSSFLVKCLMNEGPSQSLQVTVVPATLPTTSNTQPNNVVYPSATTKNIKSLVQSSAYCLQAVKVTCQGIMLSSLFTWTDGNGIDRSNFGVDSSQSFCPCGLSNACAGIPGELRDSMKARKCNCNTPNHNAVLSDAVLITNLTLLPISSIKFLLPSNASDANIIKIGPLMCSSTKIDFDECKTGFHDCDIHANCTDTKTGFTCTCQAGWQGLGGNEMYANGRSCIDDDECALLKCPSVSDCVNKPGSFECNCFVGFNKTSPTTCEDINECALNSSICDKNANCINTFGSYICSCKAGYRGSGVPGDCDAVATCGCWGDPHCLSFDGNWLHYQGLCKYTLVRDECTMGLPNNNTQPSFEVIMKNWDQNQGPDTKVSWAKEITVKIKKYTIMLKLSNDLTVDGQKTSIPFSPKNADGTPVGFEVSYYGRNLRLTSDDGLEVKWDGASRIDVTVSSKLKGKVCGLCGNYNMMKFDDWIIGPKCNAAGKITDLLNLFGDSWRNDDPPDTDATCSSEICRETPNEKPCSPDIEAKSTLACENLRTKFAQCEVVMKQMKKSMDEYITSCIYDQCFSKGDPTEMMCKTAESLAQKCLEEFKVRVNYRSENFCNMKCKENMVYSPCASPCQPTCYNNSDSRMCNGGCVENCVCISGYVMENGKCIKPETCGCVMPDGTYYSDGEKRTNENCTRICGCNRQTGQLECANITCSNDAFCDFKDDDYGCHCKNGFMGDGINCKDIDECSIQPSICSENANCKNTIGSFSCSCKEGYEGNGFTCTNINECYPVSPCENITEECFDKVPGYDCKCRGGFMKNSTTGKCDDKNECADTGNLCDRVSTTCNNTFGSYRCECKYGFRPSPIDSFVCTDVNECNLVHECDKMYAKCTNTPGSYYCTCNYGYQGDGRNCTDIDECKTKTVCKRPDATCVNLPGSYECRCLDGKPGCDGDNPCNTVKCTKPHERCYLGLCICENGYNVNPATNQCEDVDECKTAANDCASKKGKCLNLDGSYECECLYGYRMSSDNICENINECTENLHNCGENAECVDTDGGYYCQCKMGFTGHCDECRDIDECALGMNECDSNYATCTNTLGSFLCQCNDGYSGDGSICSEIDECVLGLHNCTKSNQFCFNTDGGFQCKCTSGYTLDSSSSCVDENECLYADNGCDENAHCINSEGSYKCVCKIGYTGSGKTCSPIDGYVICGNTLCPINSQCNNGTCQCKLGYEDSANQCININECINQTSCDINANCIDTPGSFICHCKDGYVGNGYDCYVKTTDVDLCKSVDYCIDGDCYDNVCHCPQGYGFRANRCVDERCKNACPSNAICSTSSGSVVCSCSPGFSISSDNSQCIDIDECFEKIDDCQTNSICVNQNGFFDCKCPSNFMDVFEDGKICIPVQPSNCTEECPTGQYCKNGSCSCLPGLQSNTKEGALTCEKVSTACLPGSCPLHSFCKERLFGYLCQCEAGFEGVGVKSCTDIDECGSKTDNCSKTEDCLNTPGSFSCSCKKGYTRNSNSGSCELINQCNCGSNGMCGTNNKCLCKPGYEENSKGVCTDINECDSQQSPCHLLARCNNTEGSYKCYCPENYYGDPEVKCIEDKCQTKTLTCKDGEVCKRSAYGSVCSKIKCNGTDVFMLNKCIPESEICASIECRANAHCRVENGRPECLCDSGYSGDGSSCIDIDECSSGLVSCPNNSRCRDKQGAYYCACNVGFERQARARPSDPCFDINECLIPNTCSSNAACENTVGSFICRCKPGYIGDGIYNCDVDSKCERQGRCHQSASCVLNRQNGIYECQCNSGYSGDGVSSCSKDNYCFSNGQNACHKNAHCVQFNSTYRCICPDGFQGDGYNFCNDIDECASVTSHNCSEPLERCVNHDGHFSCECSPGATLVEGVCTDIDECSGNGTNKCSPFAICHNTRGSYSCKCDHGFYGDGVKCSDIDECKLGLANCSYNSLCFNRPGSFDCQCQAGSLGNGTTCNDKDECKERSKPGASDGNQCDENAVCKNKNPGYSCECKPGYQGTGWFCVKENPCNKPGACGPNQLCSPNEDNTDTECVCKNDFKPDKNGTCVPKQECTEGTDTCDRDSQNCVQLERGFQCECKPGFNAVGNTCQDKNECDPKSPDFAAQPCQASGGGCLNTPGGFVCTCPQKKDSNDNSTCKPIDSCANKLDKCDRKLEECIPNEGDSGYSCRCIDGFEKVNGTCTDINECEQGTDSCHKNSTCKNTIGSYECFCPSNLKLDKTKKGCTDRNECMENPMVCGDLSTCVNTEGSFKCVCVTGFLWNGKNCEDIDECANKTHPCHKFAECSNVPGSCACKCLPGFTGDGIYKCQEIDTCPPKVDVKCPTGTFCNMVDNIIFCNCTNGYSDLDNMECIGDVCYKQCSDIDECSKSKSPCHASATCVNKDGGFKCICPSHLVGDGKVKCEDQNECALNTHTCNLNTSYCENLDNALDSLKPFQCHCFDGYVEIPGTHTCVNKNECLNPAENNCVENSECIDTEGSFECRCLPGFKKLPNKRCIDVDECAEELHNCSAKSECQNTKGGYDCKCKSGYQQSASSSLTCEDIDECKNPTSCSKVPQSKCMNNDGSFECVCPLGTSLQGGACLDVDECLIPNVCKKKGNCKNSNGSYLCNCPPGTIKLPNGDCEEINECLEDEDRCKKLNGPDSTCYDLPLGYGCICPKGFINEPEFPELCKDVNECDLNVHNCPASSSECFNTYGGYGCTCQRGFTKDNSSNCVDIDECKTEEGNNVKICNSGKCRNTEGGYICDCPDGFVNDNNQCIDINECTLDPVSQLASNCDKENGECINTVGSFICDCKKGYEMIKNSTKCQDIDECSYPNPCNNGICNNKPGSFECICNKGFALVNGKCSDIDECLNSSTVCGPDTSGICKNKIGSYECKCNTGFENSGGLSTNPCQPTNECVKQNVTCPKNSKCVDRSKGYECVCKEGFKEDEIGICRNINECLVEESCHYLADCIDTEGSYTCKCKYGYKGDGKVTCKTICGENACLPTQICNVVNGDQFECGCQCQGASCRETVPVCDSNGITYNSEKQMVETLCKQNKTAEIEYYHECQKSCAKVVCPGTEICSMSNGLPICSCQNCTKDELQPNKICSNIGIEFQSICQMKRWICETKREISVSYNGPCHRPIDCVLSEWTSWSGCSKVCGIGQSSRKREVLKPAMYNGDCDFQLYETSQCYNGPCRGDPCENMTCKLGSFCDAGKCVCPSCLGEQTEDPVCGKIGQYQAGSYRTLCTLIRNACVYNSSFEYIHKGICGEHIPSEPVKCSMVTNFRFVETADNCTSVEPVRTNICSGGCGKNPKFCCRPLATRILRVKFKCLDESFVYREIKSILSCECKLEEKITTLSPS